MDKFLMGLPRKRKAEDEGLPNVLQKQFPSQERKFGNHCIKVR